MQPTRDVRSHSTRKSRGIVSWAKCFKCAPESNVFHHDITKRNLFNSSPLCLSSIFYLSFLFTCPSRLLYLDCLLISSHFPRPHHYFVGRGLYLHEYSIMAPRKEKSEKASADEGEDYRAHCKTRQANMPLFLQRQT